MHSTGSSTSIPAVTTPVIVNPTIEPTGITKPDIAVDCPLSFSPNQVLAIKLIELHTNVCDATARNVPSSRSQN